MMKIPKKAQYAKTFSFLNCPFSKKGQHTKRSFFLSCTLSKRAQIQQVFIYVMALLVIGALLLMGFKLIRGLLTQKCDIEELSLDTSMERVIQGNIRYGRADKASLSAPCDFDQICFIDSRAELSDITVPSFETDYPVIWADISEGVDTNVYLRNGDDQTIPVMYDSRIHTSSPENNNLNTPYVCITRKQGEFNFWVEGFGGNGILVTS